MSKIVIYSTDGKKEVDAPKGAVAWKYADATEEAKWVYDIDEAREIAREDPSLIVWVK